MKRYNVVDEATGIVENCIVLDDPKEGEKPFSIPGKLIVKEEKNYTGGTYADGQFTEKSRPEPPPVVEKTISEKVESMLKKHGLTKADLIAELGR